MQWEVCAGPMKELVSETEEQSTLLEDVTVRTCCLAMFANPMRERAAKNRGRRVKTDVDGTQYAAYSMLLVHGCYSHTLTVDFYC